MISTAKCSSEVNSQKNFNENPAEPQEFATSENTKNSQVWFEKCRTWMSYGKLKWHLKFNHYHSLKFPFFIFFISALEVLIFFVAEENLKRILIYDIKKKTQIWRFLTYMLLHTDSVHLSLNVIIQGLLGIPLEFEQGQLRCAAVYFGGGVAGSLGVSAFGAFTLMVGASGGVYAVLTSQIPNVILSFGTIKYASFRIVTVAVLVGSDVIYIFIHLHFYRNEKPQIGWVAHASGAAAGLILGFLLFNGTAKWRKKFQITTSLVLAFLSAIIFFLNIHAFGFQFELTF